MMSTKPAYIDPMALVEAGAEIEPGASIWNWTKVRKGARIGEGTSVGQSCYIDADVTIGKRCKIQNGVSVYKGVTLGDDVFVGPCAVFTNDLTPRAHGAWAITPTAVEDGASIGANATIICGTTLGRHCMVAAGAVVTASVDAHMLVMGVPAKTVDYVTISGERLHWDLEKGVPPQSMLTGKSNQGR